MKTVSEPQVEEQDEVEQPGLSKLREVVANYLPGQLPSRGSLRQDLLAGLNSALGSAPDGMANGILAGVNPVYGLYGSMAGPIAGGMVTSTKLMVITSTSAAAIAANQMLGSRSAEAREQALFLMVLLIGAFQILFGVLRFGRLIRFVSYSVMTGFLSGVAMLMVLSQVPTVSGYEATGSNKVAETLDVLLNFRELDVTSLGLAALTLLLIITLTRTRLGNLGSLVAIAVPSVVVALFGLQSVRIVEDVSPIPRGLPAPFWPSLSSLSWDLVSGAIAIAAILLVQGTGVSQSVPNPDGSRTSVSRDFIAQGVANLAAGFFRGLPVGGSLSSTALSVMAGPRTRMAAIFTGVWMAGIILIFPGVVSLIAMPALGALLIHAGITTIKPSEVASIWNTGWPSRLVSVTTFLAILFLPIQVAVGIGVVFSALLYVTQSSTDVVVVELAKRPDGRIEERKAPRQLPPDAVTVLDVYGHLFFAGARTLERLLPRPQDSQNAVVILRLRSQATLGATLIEVLANYADKLREMNGRLYLSGVGSKAYDQIIRTGKLHLSGPVQAYEATPIRGQSTLQAVADAKTWLVDQGATTASDVPSPNSSTTMNEQR